MSGGNRRLSNEPDIELPNLSTEEGSSSLLGGANTAPTGELSGIYFGILNIYTTIPQFIGTLIATIVFSILEPGKSRELAGDADEPVAPNADGPNAIAVCLFIGAIASVVASFATRKLKRL